MRRWSIRYYILAWCAPGVILLNLAFAKQWSQNQRERVIHVRVPFSFRVSDRTLPSGEYLIEPTGPFIFRIHRATDSADVWITTTPVASRAPSGKSLVLFHRIDEQYRLSGFWWDTGRIGRVLRPPPNDRAAGEKPIAATAEVNVEP
jgi:hypothetical protein